MSKSQVLETKPGEQVVNPAIASNSAADMPMEYYWRLLVAVIGFRQTLAQILEEENRLATPPATIMSEIRALQTSTHDMEVWLARRALKRYPSAQMPLGHIPAGSPISHV